MAVLLRRQFDVAHSVTEENYPTAAFGRLDSKAIDAMHLMLGFAAFSSRLHSLVLVFSDFENLVVQFGWWLQLL